MALAAYNNLYKKAEKMLVRNQDKWQRNRHRVLSERA